MFWLQGEGQCPIRTDISSTTEINVPWASVENNQALKTALCDGITAGLSGSSSVDCTFSAGRRGRSLQSGIVVQWTATYANDTAATDAGSSFDSNSFGAALKSSFNSSPEADAEGINLSSPAVPLLAVCGGHRTHVESFCSSSLSQASP